jgi:hypothetical protein
MEHNLILPAKNHGIVSALGPYTNAVNRKLQALTSADYGKVALQSDDSSLWIVVPSIAAPGTYVWRSVTGTVEEVATGPLTIMVGHVFAGFIPETGLTAGGWTDVGPNGYSLNVGACTVQTNQLNGYSCAKFVSASSNRLYRVSAPHAAPGTTPLYRYTVLRIDTFFNNLPAVAMGNFNELALLMHTASPQLSQFSGGVYGNANANGAAVGSFKLIREKFTNSAADSIKCGAGAAITGTSAGNTVGSGIYLGGSNSSFGDVSIAEIWMFDQDPGSSLDSYFTTKFGAGILT